MVRGGSPEICGTVVMMANRMVVFVQEPHHMPSKIRCTGRRAIHRKFPVMPHELI